MCGLFMACSDDLGDAVAVPVDHYDPAGIVSARQARDSAFRGSESPIPELERATFEGLSYYPPDPKFAFSASLNLFDDPRTVRIAATKGDVRMMTRYGRFILDIDGKRCSLTVFKSNPESADLFVPFKDRTSGEETYEVGRYLDLEEHEESKPYLLDFNLSYNPYCAYSDDFTCPIVPAENVLPVEIRAGERFSADTSSPH